MPDSKLFCHPSSSDCPMARTVEIISDSKSQYSCLRREPVVEFEMISTVRDRSLHRGAMQLKASEAMMLETSSCKEDWRYRKNIVNEEKYEVTYSPLTEMDMVPVLNEKTDSLAPSRKCPERYVLRIMDNVNKPSSWRVFYISIPNRQTFDDTYRES